MVFNSYLIEFLPIFSIDSNIHTKIGECDYSCCKNINLNAILSFTCVCHKVWYCSEFCALENEIPPRNNAIDSKNFFIYIGLFVWQ